MYETSWCSGAPVPLRFVPSGWRIVGVSGLVEFLLRPQSQLGWNLTSSSEGELGGGSDLGHSEVRRVASYDVAVVLGSQDPKDCLILFPIFPMALSPVLSHPPAYRRTHASSMLRPFRVFDSDGLPFGASPITASHISRSAPYHFTGGCRSLVTAQAGMTNCRDLKVCMRSGTFGPPSDTSRRSHLPTIRPQNLSWATRR